MRNIATLAPVLAIVPAILASWASGQTIIDVDDDAAVGGNGATWNTAYKFLQDGIADAPANTPAEVRVAPTGRTSPSR